MKIIIALASVLISSFFAQAQVRKPVLNHLAVYVYDLKKSVAFYQDVIGLDTVPEPFHDGRHKWLSIGCGNLHLIQGAKESLTSEKNSHLCLSVASVDAFILQLRKAAVLYEDWKGQPQTVTLRVDGVKQIYFKDPDGYWIEINDAKN